MKRQFGWGILGAVMAVLCVAAAWKSYHPAPHKAPVSAPIHVPEADGLQPYHEGVDANAAYAEGYHDGVKHTRRLFLGSVEAQPEMPPAD